MNFIPLSKPTFLGTEKHMVAEVFQNGAAFTGTKYKEICEKWFRENYGQHKYYFTNSCTQALEMAALVLDIQPGDEIIAPSFTYVSTVNAFAVYGAVPVFVDIRPDDMNIDAGAVNAAITSRTKAIIAVHYAGMACEIEQLAEIADQNGISLIEDAAHSIFSRSNSRLLGTFGQMSVFSFDHTKNITCGSGGLLVINNPDMVQRAEEIYENGTNKVAFLKGETDHYSWINKGSKYGPPESSLAFLSVQLESAREIINHRLELWECYFKRLSALENSGKINLPKPGLSSKHNGHIFFIKTNDRAERTALSGFLKMNGIGSAFHFIPLHSSPFGERIGKVAGSVKVTDEESQRLLRLPLYHELSLNQVKDICEKIIEFYEKG